MHRDLKISKSSVEFFGYVCSGKSYRLSKERADSVASIPFPRDTKSMQRFLGAAMYFKPFIYDYSAKTAPLNEMVHRDFVWDETQWKVDYRKAFDDFKQDILHSVTLSLDWFLYVDSSDIASGVVLLQRTADGMQQILAFVSPKFSGPSKSWSTYEKEAFAMCHAVSQLSRYLAGKFFILLTDHRNLVWIESSVVPKIIRIRLFLQTFNFEVIHIPGAQNVFADWLSRMHVDQPVSDVLDAPENFGSLLVIDRVSEALRSVHNARMGHGGLRRTWKLLNTYYPCHSIKMQTIVDFIATCPLCQKYRLDASDSLPAPVRSLL